MKPFTYTRMTETGAAIQQVMPDRTAQFIAGVQI